MDTGLFAAQGLEVTLTRTEGSIPQIKDMMAGKYQIATTAIDSAISGSTIDSGGSMMPAAVKPRVTV